MKDLDDLWTLAAGQRARLEKAGYVVRRIAEFDVWHRRERVCADVRSGRAEARRRVAA